MSRRLLISALTIWAAAYLELLTTQQIKFRARLDYLDALDELWSSASRLEGLLLDELITDLIIALAAFTLGVWIAS